MARLEQCSQEACAIAGFCAAKNFLTGQVRYGVKPHGQWTPEGYQGVLDKTAAVLDRAGCAEEPALRATLPLYQLRHTAQAQTVKPL